MVRIVRWLWVKLLPFQLVLIMGAIGLSVGLLIALIITLARGHVPSEANATATQKAVAASVDSSLLKFDEMGKVFTPEVQHWATQIVTWSRQYGVDANILATVIQLESCGDFAAGSGAGAQGLFQVMPFHFAQGEDMHDPATNAKRGIEYLKGGLEKAGGHVGLALAGYNGGWGVINQGWSQWYTETKVYYLWGSQLYLDAITGKTTAQSAALQNWLTSGGSRLCAQAAARLATPTPTQATVTAAMVH